MPKKRKAKRISRRIKRMMPVQNIVNTGPVAAVVAGETNDYYLNSAHLLSMMNRKAFHQVTKAGHLKNYGLEVQVFNMVNASTAIRTASLAYPTYNATRAWHFARKERYADAGFKLSDLGYGSRMRFALDSTMTDLAVMDAGYLRPSGFVDSTKVGEWDYSDIIVTPPANTETVNTDVKVHDLYDSFKLHLVGDHTNEAGGVGDETKKYTKVGMIQAWTENRRGWAEPANDEVVQAENPLAFARMSESSSMYITEEVADEQKQAPPYSNDDGDGAASIFASLMLNGQLETAFPNPTTNDDMIVAPGGLAKISITNNDDSAGIPYISVRIIELD